MVVAKLINLIQSKSCYHSIVTCSVHSKNSLLALRENRSIITICSALVLAKVVVGYAVFIRYKKDFGHRLSRHHIKSPTSSNLEPPDVKSWKSSKLHDVLLKNSDSYQANIDSCESFKRILKKSKFDRLVYAPKKNEKPKADELHMDHICVTYFQLLWAIVFVGSFATLLYLKNVTLLRLRVFLAKYNLIKKNPADLEALVGKLLLDQSLAIHYLARTKKDSDLGNIAGFLFPGKYHCSL